ncbi:MAG: 1,2-phenylacetyl-CoA epoxidase subunit PaaD [Bacteroidota bacterium]
MVKKTAYSRDNIFKLLSAIPDPEIPVITIRELGVLRDVRMEGDAVVIDITPTYSGCPAMKMIEDQIREEMDKAGISKFRINLVYSPAWTTDWMTEEAKEKLRAFGIAPPEKTSSDKNVLMGKKKIIACPRCGSTRTEMVSQFGSTACKALYKCLDCHEPFDYFKCI